MTHQRVRNARRTSRRRRSQGLATFLGFPTPSVARHLSLHLTACATLHDGALAAVAKALPKRAASLTVHVAGCAALSDAAATALADAVPLPPAAGGAGGVATLLAFTGCPRVTEAGLAALAAKSTVVAEAPE